MKLFPAGPLPPANDAEFRPYRNQVGKDSCACGGEMVSSRFGIAFARMKLYSSRGRIISPALRFRPSRFERARRLAHRATAQIHHPRPDDLRSEAAPPARLYRTHPRDASLSGHVVRAARLTLLHSRACSQSPSRPLADDAQRTAPGLSLTTLLSAT